MRDSTTDKRRWTIAEIARTNSAAGSHYFDPGTLRFFNQRRSDFHVCQIAGRVFVYGRGRTWGWSNSVHAWSVAEFDPKTGEIEGYTTKGGDLLPDSLKMNHATTAADIRLALRAIAEPDRATCPSTDGRALEVWEMVRAEKAKAAK